MLICRDLNISIKDQMAFTWQRIMENESNYSAWHFRGELLHRLLLDEYSEDVSTCLQMIGNGMRRERSAL